MPVCFSTSAQAAAPFSNPNLAIAVCSARTARCRARRSSSRSRVAATDGPCQLEGFRIITVAGQTVEQFDLATGGAVWVAVRVSDVVGHLKDRGADLDAERLGFR